MLPSVKTQRYESGKLIVKCIIRSLPHCTTISQPVICPCNKSCTLFHIWQHFIFFTDNQGSSQIEQTIKTTLFETTYEKYEFKKKYMAVRDINHDLNSEKAN